MGVIKNTSIKRIILIILLFSLLLLTGCIFYNSFDSNYDKRPIRQNNTRWVSTDPDIWFQVNDDLNFGNVGELKIDGKTIKIKLAFDYGSGVNIIDLNLFELNQQSNEEYIDSTLITGQCKFSKTKLVVTIGGDDVNKVLDPSVKQIVFVRQNGTFPPITEETTLGS